MSFPLIVVFIMSFQIVIVDGSDVVGDESLYEVCNELFAILFELKLIHLLHYFDH